MSPSKLPDPEDLAELVSKVTGTMCGTTFVPGDPFERGESLSGQMAMISLVGEPAISVVVSSDARGSRELGSAFLGCAPADLTQQMIDDVIAELLNMVAGQLSTALALNHSLGLPRRTTLAEIASREDGLDLDEAVLLRSAGRVDLRLWILERANA